ncbi:alpha/beta hydrolase [Novosphingobium sp. Gsoil 351]|uniref:alpha/beta hydrolase n=1 Tax=Novosphingobium sp. Gsoil 351 TaxID=2675225 RepID=UPI0012B49182|nr:alpha/beta hydrolase [Novosphingobium sp. Gsoil 351]QGN53672.1 alpha/beta fold hydrolase [Novosphingobium sp. Gsoil 351]
MATEAEFTGANGRRIFTQSWLPEGTPRDHVVVAHGYAEHSGRYDAVARFLTARGFAVHALDHHGHGRSEGARAVIERFAQADADIDTLIDKVRRDSGLATVKLIGHSMGGSLALNYALNHQDKLSGLVLSGPAIGGALPFVQRWLLALVSAIAPHTGMIALDADGVSRDPAVVAAYKADPQVFRGKIPARTAYEMFRAIRSYPARVGSLTVPCLLMHGDADALVSAVDAAPLFQGIASADKTIRIWPGLFHEIFNEPERDEVLALTADWLEAHPAR